MPGGDHGLRVQFAGLHYLVNLNHRHPRAGGHDRVEVAGGAAVNQVAAGVGLVSADQGEVGAQAVLQDVLASVDYPAFLALGDEGAGAGGGVKGRDAGAASAQSLRQGSLGHQFQIDLAAAVGQLELGRAGNRGGNRERRDGLGDLSVFHQHAVVDGGAARRGSETDHAGDAGGVADDGQVAAAAIPQRNEEVVRHAARPAKAVNEDGGPIGQVRDGGRAVGVNLAGRIAGREGEVHFAEGRRDGYGGSGDGANILGAPSRGHLDQCEPGVSHAEYRYVGDDGVHAVHAVGRIGQGIYDVGRAVIGSLWQYSNDTARAHQVNEAGVSLRARVVGGVVTGKTSAGVDLRGGQD